MSGMSGAAAGETKYNFDRVVRLLISTVVVISLFFLLRFLSDVLLPFAAAVLFAYLLNPIVNIIDGRLNRRSLRKGLAIR